MKIQLCFQVKSREENEDVLKKLRDLKLKLDETYNSDYTVHSCHLPMPIVVQKCFDSTISKGLVEIFGSKYICEVTADNFDDAMLSMNDYRIATAKKVDRIAIVSEQAVSNIALELEYFTENNVFCI